MSEPQDAPAAPDTAKPTVQPLVPPPGPSVAQAAPAGAPGKTFGETTSKVQIKVGTVSYDVQAGGKTVTRKAKPGEVITLPTAVAKRLVAARHAVLV